MSTPYFDDHEALTFHTEKDPNGPPRVLIESKIPPARPYKHVEEDPNGLDPHAPGAKLDAGKIRPTLIFNSMHRALEAVIEVGEYGAKKYTKDGWQFVEDGFERYTDAMHRHLISENLALHDPQTNLTHAAHVAWNALARLELLLRMLERGDA